MTGVASELLEDLSAEPTKASSVRTDESTSSKLVATAPRSDTTIPPAVKAEAVAPPPPIHDADRASEILRQFRLHLFPELRQATIHLSPVELGQVSIRLSLEEGRVTATLRAERKETLRVLEKHIPELKASLAQHGIEAGDFDLALGFRERDGNGEEARSSRPNVRESPRIDNVLAKNELTRLARVAASLAGGVDTYA